MPDKEESTLHTDEGDFVMETAGPYRGEIGQAINAETMTGDPSKGGDAATTPLRQGSLGEKQPEATQGTNPKNTANARPD